MTGDLERIQNQSHEEWWADYDSYSDDTYPHIRREQNKVTKGRLLDESPKATGGQPHQSTSSKKELFIFDSFRTTKLGRLVITCTSVNSGIMGDAFFNVDITKQRGSGKHRTGKNGQFYPAPDSNFRRFWMDAVKKPPIRWSTVHKEMRSKLKGLVFEGETRDCYRSSGEPYIQLINLKYFGTELVQNLYKVGTEMVQTFGTGKPIKHNTVKDFT